jgi:uncharacterized repeat protein (TIGR03803 family)
MTRLGQSSEKRLRAVTIALALAIVLVSAVTIQAQTYKVLYNFTGGADGGYPFANLIQDSKGNLYSTTYSAGTSGYGTVFKLTKTGKETVLYSFTGGSDGGYPYSGLVRGPTGILYGTTSYSSSYDGTVYSLAPKTGKETVLYSFTGGTDGGYPYAGLVQDSKGNLYGTTDYGGASDYGTVFEVAPKTRTETVLHSFGFSDGAYPMAGLVRDSKGNLYGVNEIGGTYDAGTVFMVDSTGTETVLYNFTGGDDGAYPIYGYLARDSAGNLYGTTWNGGASYAGTVFKVTPAGKETVLYSFGGGTDGGYPMAGLVRDSKGNLYGTTGSGGASGNGTVFKVGKNGQETVLHSFDYSDGAFPYSGLLRDGKGTLYGTAYYGGTHGYGVVFEVTP